MTTLDAFVENMDGAPLLLDDFAEAAVAVSDCPDLKAAAQRFLNSRNEFLRALADVQVELG